MELTFSIIGKDPLLQQYRHQFSDGYNSFKVQNLSVGTIGMSINTNTPERNLVN